MTGRGFSLDGAGFGEQRGSAQLAEEDVSLVFADDVVRELPSRRVVGDDIFRVLEQRLDLEPESRWVGYFGYAARRDLRASSAPGVPDAIWMRVPHGERKFAPDRRKFAPEKRKVAPNKRKFGEVPRGYVEAFEEVQRRLRAGDSYEVNLTRRVERDAEVDPFETYERLCVLNPAPYAGFLTHHGVHLLSASPECFLSVRGRRIETRPIKGTTPRGEDDREDALMRQRLATDPRFRAENLMITDLMRNDLSQVCEVGSVVVPRLMEVESYAAVHQLVSTVEGRLRDDATTMSAVRALFPAGSMTGAPKMRTMEIIDAVEETPRGVYAGAFGWIDGSGDAELAVVIRSLVGTPDGRWSAGTGGAVTVATTAELEWAESEWKLNRLLAALN